MRSQTALQDAPKWLVECKDFHTYFNAWTWPKQIPVAKSGVESGRFIADASLTLSCTSVMIRFLRDVMRPNANEAQTLAIDRHILAWECVMLLNTRSCTPDELEESTKKFADAHVAAHGHGYWVFKFHQALDLAHQFRRFL